MAVARFDTGYHVDFRSFDAAWLDALSRQNNINVSVSAIGAPTTVYEDRLTILSSEGVIGIFPTFYGSGITVGGGRVTGGTMTAYHFNDGSDLNTYVRGFSIAATLLNSHFDGNAAPLVTAMFAGNDKITLIGSFTNYITAGTGNDTVYGGGAADGVFGQAGNDVLHGNNGMDAMKGGDGVDTLNGGAGNDLLYGNGQADRINGGSGSDSLWGGDAADMLIGGAGLDAINGGAGNDTLHGQAGSDTLMGGAGADHFAFRIGAGSDRIVDFQDGIDKIRIESEAGGPAININVNYAAGNATVTFFDVSVLIENVAENSLSVAADFVLIPI